MKKRYLDSFKEIYAKNLMQERDNSNLTLQQMASKLHIDPRSYIEIDHGRSTGSALTLAMFLIYCCSDVNSFLETLKDEFDKTGGEAA